LAVALDDELAHAVSFPARNPALDKRFSLLESSSLVADRAHDFLVSDELQD